ncbi:hypothetical protein [Dyella sedimenti]|uniref:hypothetical protein n=1 Tax=Dyella sedimenti TaxID=2919947 RepID=UPI001FAABCB3|nr:hypothetical protein [Dyella sedimenti]
MDSGFDEQDKSFRDPGVISLPPLAEALRQLLEARQEKLAMRLLDQCDRGLVMRLNGLSTTELHARLLCLLKTRLRRRMERGTYGTRSVLLALAGVLNLWCREGRRHAIRCVLREMSDRDRDALMRSGELEVEVASMLRDLDALL